MSDNRDECGELMRWDGVVVGPLNISHVETGQTLFDLIRESQAGIIGDGKAPRGEVPITLAEAKARIEALELRCGELRQLIVDVINGKIEIGDPDA